jgi:hypothetical protein
MAIVETEIVHRVMHKKSWTTKHISYVRAMNRDAEIEAATKHTELPDCCQNPAKEMAPTAKTIRDIHSPSMP